MIAIRWATGSSFCDKSRCNKKPPTEVDGWKRTPEGVRSRNDDDRVGAHDGREASTGRRWALRNQDATGRHARHRCSRARRRDGARTVRPAPTCKAPRPCRAQLRPHPTAHAAASPRSSSSSSSSSPPPGSPATGSSSATTPQPSPRIKATKTVEGGNVDGTWTLSANDANGSFVQYRVHEQFAAGLVDNDATGKSTDVTGTMTINGTTVSDIDRDREPRGAEVGQGVPRQRPEEPRPRDRQVPHRQVRRRRARSRSRAHRRRARP